MSKYSSEVMDALTTNNCEKAVLDYLLSFNLENWRIFVENYAKLIPYEIEKIIEIIAKKMDFHMIIDFISIADIIGKSITLSSTIIKLFQKVNLENYTSLLNEKIEKLLKSPNVLERRIGLFIAGYLERDEFFEIIEEMTNYDVLFEDAYFSLGQMNNPSILKMLSEKFIANGKNQIQQNAIVKILVQKGNPLAAIWLFRNKEFDLNLPYTQAVFLAKEIAQFGIKPVLFLDSDDEYLQPIILKFIQAISAIFSYDFQLVNDLELTKVVKKIISKLNNHPTLDYIKTLYAIKNSIEELYNTINPYIIDKETRGNIINSWELLQKFPNQDIINYLKQFIKGKLEVNNPQFILCLRIIRNFKLNDFELEILNITKNNLLKKEQEFEIINCLGQIGSHDSAEYIISKIEQYVNKKKRNLIEEEGNNLIDFLDEFDNELIKIANQSFDQESINWTDENFEEAFYLNALFCLKNLKAEKISSILLEALDDNQPFIRYQAINSLKEQNILNSFIEEKLIIIAKNDKYLSVQKEAIQTLGCLNSQKVIPYFIDSIKEAVENGLFEDITDEEEFDNRWEIDTQEDYSQKVAQDIGEINSPQKTNKNSNFWLNINNKNNLDEILSKINKQTSDSLELREDLAELNDDFQEEYEFLDKNPIPNYNPGLEFPSEVNEKNINEEEWMENIGEQFKQITIIESIVEALKITEAHIPINDLKTLIEKPIDQELYIDLLIILAKSKDVFAINELLELYNNVDFIQAREIINTLLNVNYRKNEHFFELTQMTNDWIINDLVK